MSTQLAIHEGMMATDTLPLLGRTAVVTGASRGIGRSIALHLGAAGANVVVNYRSTEVEADRVAERIELSSDGQAITAQADVADSTAVERLAATAAEHYEAVDILVNNAGITRDARFERMSAEDWHRVIDVNLNGVFNTTRTFYGDLKASDQGRLINISSVIGQTGNFGQANYAASKSALSGFTRSLAAELAPHGTTANCVAPGFTSTEMVEAVPEDIQDRIKADIPLERFATVDEIATTVAFLAGPAAEYITGETINVNGGMYG